MCLSRVGDNSIHCFFFFNDTATTEIYTLSLHDALPICLLRGPVPGANSPRPAATQPQKKAMIPVTQRTVARQPRTPAHVRRRDRKSTRLNSSHLVISYAAFCLKKKNNHLLAMLHSNTIT